VLTGKQNTSQNNGLLSPLAFLVSTIRVGNTRGNEFRGKNAYI